MSFQNTFKFVIFASLATHAHAQLGEAPMPSGQLVNPPAISLEQTTKWIASKIDGTTIIKVRKYRGITPQDPFRSDAFQKITFDGCKARLSNKLLVDGSESNSLSEFDQILFSLQDIDPDSVVASNDAVWLAPEGADENGERIATVVLRSTGEKDLFKKFSYKNVSWDAARSIASNNGIDIAAGAYRILDISWINVWTPNMELAERLANAFRHAAKLCIQQAAAQKMKNTKPSNEPF